MSPRSQVRVWPTISQRSLSSVQAIPAGRSSVTTTSRAMPSPMFLTVMAKTASSPALIGLFEAVLVTSTSGHRTVTSASSSSPPSLPVVTTAVLSMTPQSAASVVPEMWTRKLSPDAMRSSVQRSWSGVRLVSMRHDTPVVSPDGVPTDQTMPAGRSSVTRTPVALPSPLFETSMSNPIASPALTGPAGFAVFVIRRSGQLTTIVSDDSLLPRSSPASLEAATEAVFGSSRSRRRRCRG